MAKARRIAAFVVTSGMLAGLAFRRRVMRGVAREKVAGGHTIGGASWNRVPATDNRRAASSVLIEYGERVVVGRARGGKTFAPASRARVCRQQGSKRQARAARQRWDAQRERGHAHGVGTRMRSRYVDASVRRFDATSVHAWNSAVVRSSARRAWTDGRLGSLGLTGENLTIAVIDTGIDYVHANFGGPATKRTRTRRCSRTASRSPRSRWCGATTSRARTTRQRRRRLGDPRAGRRSDGLQRPRHHVAGRRRLRRLAEGRRFRPLRQRGAPFGTLRIGPASPRRPSSTPSGLRLRRLARPDRPGDRAGRWTQRDERPLRPLRRDQHVLGSPTASVHEASRRGGGATRAAGVIVVTRRQHGDTYFISGSQGCGHAVIATGRASRTTRADRPRLRVAGSAVYMSSEPGGPCSPRATAGWSGDRLEGHRGSASHDGRLPPTHRARRRGQHRPDRSRHLRFRGKGHEARPRRHRRDHRQRRDDLCRVRGRRAPRRYDSDGVVSRGTRPIGVS